MVSGVHVTWGPHLFWVAFPRKGKRGVVRNRGPCVVKFTWGGSGLPTTGFDWGLATGATEHARVVGYIAFASSGNSNFGVPFALACHLRGYYSFDATYKNVDHVFGVTTNVGLTTFARGYNAGLRV